MALRSHRNRSGNPKVGKGQGQEQGSGGPGVVLDDSCQIKSSRLHREAQRRVERAGVLPSQRFGSWLHSLLCLTLSKSRPFSQGWCENKRRCGARYQVGLCPDNTHCLFCPVWLWPVCPSSLPVECLQGEGRQAGCAHRSVTCGAPRREVCRSAPARSSRWGSQPWLCSPRQWGSWGAAAELWGK